MQNNMTNIPIDLDVFKALQNQITYFDEPLNNVLRRVLKLDSSLVSTITNEKEAKPSHWAIVKTNRGICAVGAEMPGNGIRVLKGATFSKTVADKFSGSYALLREQMIKEGKLNADFVLIEDYPFDSKSAAASVILGAQNNPNAWRR